MICVRVAASDLGPVLTAIRGGLPVAQAVAGRGDGRTFAPDTANAAGAKAPCSQAARPHLTNEAVGAVRAALPTGDHTCGDLLRGAVAHPTLLHGAPLIEIVPPRVRDRYREGA